MGIVLLMEDMQLPDNEVMCPTSLCIAIDIRYNHVIELWLHVAYMYVCHVHAYNCSSYVYRHIILYMQGFI